MMDRNSFDPAYSPLGAPIESGHIAREVITADNLDDWLVKLDFVDTKEATLFALTVNKCFDNKSDDLAQEMLRIALSRCSVGAKRVVQVGEIATGIMMPGYHGDKSDDKSIVGRLKRFTERKGGDNNN